MPTALTFSTTPREYVPASLRHNTNGWYVVYYEFNPFISTLERKRVRLNALRKRCNTQQEFRLQVDSIMKTINAKLIDDLATLNLLKPQLQVLQEPTMPVTSTMTMQPAITTDYKGVAASKQIAEHTPVEPEKGNLDSLRPFMPIEEVTSIYLTEKKRECRDATFRSYRAFCQGFVKWLNQRAPRCKMIQFKRSMAVEFLDYWGSREGISNRTYNNNLKMARAFFTWAIKKCYAKENPFVGQETKRVLKKKRQMIPADCQILADNYFKENNPAMRIIMRLVYTSLLRPVEISRIQVKQIDFEMHCIHMEPEQIKTYEGRDARLDSELETLLRQHIIGANPEDYLFADRKWSCGKKSQTSHSYSKAWEDMRKNVVDEDGNQLLPMEYQLYSLKDTSLNGMLKSGIDDLSAMQAAGHHDLAMTQIYADHTDPYLIEDLNIRAPKFGTDVRRTVKHRTHVAPSVKTTTYKHK